MNIPPSESEEDAADQLVQAYRRASAGERSGPSPQIREAILQHAARLTAAPDRINETSFRKSMAAANDWRWKWRAAASVAAIGLAGLLALHTFRTPSPNTSSVSQDVTSEAPPHVADVPSATATPATPPAAPPPASGAAPAVSAAAPPARANQELRDQRPAPSSDSDIAQLNRAASGSAAARATAAPAFSPWRDQVIAAVHEKFPELFNGSEVAGPVRIAMVLNSDGTVYRAARVNAGVALTQTLKIDPDELEGPATTIVLNATSEQPATITVAVAVRKSGTSGP